MLVDRRVRAERKRGFSKNDPRFSENLSSDSQHDGRRQVPRELEVEERVVTNLKKFAKKIRKTCKIVGSESDISFSRRRVKNGARAK